MTKTRADVIINGVKAKLFTDLEGGEPYKRRTIRREIQQQFLTQAENPSFQTRQDQGGLFQNSWAGGARWWKPLLTPTDLTSYFQSNHMDTWSEPGKIVPGNAHGDAINTNIHDNCIIGTDGTNTYAIGNTNTTDATMRDVYVWTPASNAFVRATTYSSGIQDDSDPFSMTFDISDGYFYVFAEVSGGGDYEVGRFNPATAAEDLSWLGPTGDIRFGSGVLANRYGVFINADTNILQVDKSGPSSSSIFTLDRELLDVRSSTDVVTQNSLFVNTTQGMYLVRNQAEDGLPTPTVFRIDRDTSGTFIGNPIATLPAGNLALSVQWHLGQLLIATTPDWRNIQDGEEDLEVVIYFVGEGGIGSLGSVLGGREEVDETPYQFLGAEGTKVYLAGSKRLWVYDAVRGGLHTAWEWETSQPNGGYKAMFRGQDSSGDEALIFLAADRINRVKTSMTDNPDTVTNFGDDETHYTLESNYFNGNVPMEQKEISKVSILREPGDGNQEWTIQISADDGAFQDVLVDSGTSVQAEASSSGITGYQFRYRAIYQTKDTQRNALRAVLVTMETGDMVTELDLVLDGSNLISLDGIRQDPEEFYDNMITLSSTSTIIPVIDNYQEKDRLQDSGGSGTNYKVIAAEIMKNTPGESVVRVLLREV